MVEVDTAAAATEEKIAIDHGAGKRWEGEWRVSESEDKDELKSKKTREHEKKKTKKVKRNQED